MRQTETHEKQSSSSSSSSSSSFYAEHCIYLPAFLGWFLFSACLSSYNKVVFGEDQLDFPCPLLLTSLHFLVQWIFAWALSSLCCPIPLGGDDVSKMPWRTYLATSIPCGLVTAMDVGLSNLSLVRISLAFYTMVKASSPVFVLMAAYVFGIEKITPSLLLVVLLISIGEFLTVLGEVEFDALGFALCISASACSGMRWTVVQLKLHTLHPPLKSTVATMRLLAPCMFLSMLLLALIIERPGLQKLPEFYSQNFDTAAGAVQTLALTFGGALLAISMIMCEFYLIMKSNAIVLMIGGVIKEMVTILVGVIVFGDHLDPQNIAGCAVVFCGVIGYKISHHLAKLEQKQKGLDDAASSAYQPVNDETINLNDKFDGDEEKKYEYDQQHLMDDFNITDEESESDCLNVDDDYDLGNFELNHLGEDDDDYDDDVDNAIHRLKMDLDHAEEHFTTTYDDDDEQPITTHHQNENEQIYSI